MAKRVIYGPRSRRGSGAPKVAKRRRKYTGVTQYFHNFEHDPAGRNHCKSAGKHPYTIVHVKGKHVISHPVAIGHGKAGKPQAFVFPVKIGKGYDLASGKKTTLKKV